MRFSQVSSEAYPQCPTILQWLFNLKYRFLANPYRLPIPESSVTWSAPPRLTAKIIARKTNSKPIAVAIPLKCSRKKSYRRVQIENRDQPDSTYEPSCNK
jgi:hypothetical protein